LKEITLLNGDISRQNPKTYVILLLRHYFRTEKLINELILKNRFLLRIKELTKPCLSIKIYIRK